MSTLLRHRQVMLLICGLLSDLTPVVHLVYEHWIYDGQKSAGKELIEAMFQEAGLPVPRDLLHSGWINYYNHKEGFIKDKTPVHVPSRWYWFRSMKGKVSCNIQHINSKIPECTFSIYWPEKTVTKNLLSVCHTICKYQTVRDLYMVGVGCNDFPEPHVFTFSKNAESLRITLCPLPTQTLSHVIQQINGCSELRFLDLSGNILKGSFSKFLPDSRLPQLEKLNLSNNALNKEHIQHLSNILQSNKLPKLHQLDLSGNTLTGCLSNFLPDSDPGLPQLAVLNLRNNALNKKDMQHLSNILQSKKLSKLHMLDLSDNTLTGCLSSFFPDSHSGFLQLKTLKLDGTALKKDDIHHITHLIQAQKLPGLYELWLDRNRLSKIETDVEHLIKACVTHHQRKLTMHLWFNDLSESFKDKWISRCEGTNIHLRF